MTRSTRGSTVGALCSGSSTSWGWTAGAAEEAAAYLVEGVRVLGTVPTKKRVVAERFFDETGGMQLVIHAPFGSRINRAWGMALRKEICRTFDFELQASATEDGVNLSPRPVALLPHRGRVRLRRPDQDEEDTHPGRAAGPDLPGPLEVGREPRPRRLRFSHGKKVPPPSSG